MMNAQLVIHPTVLSALKMELHACYA